MGSNIVHVQGQGKTKVWLIRHSMFDLRVKVAFHQLERLVIGRQGTCWVQSLLPTNGHLGAWEQVQDIPGKDKVGTGRVGWRGSIQLRI